MDDTSGGHSVDRSLHDLARYTRWRMLDPTQQNGQRVWCWLDRETGRLVYQTPDTDPNVVAVPQTARYSLAR
jgi:hypothetical protein